MIKKKALIILPVILLLSQIILKGQSGTVIVSGRDFSIFVETNGNLGFQHQKNGQVFFRSLTGNWNASNCSMNIRVDGGTLIFSVNEDASLQFSSPNRSTLWINGETMFKGEGSYNFNIFKNRAYTVLWQLPFPSFLDDYFIIGLGLAGLGLSILSPVMMIRIIKEGNLDKAEQAGIWFVLFLVGIGLIIMWLW